VRCAKCRHSWFQDGPEIDVPAGASGEDAGNAQATPTRPAPSSTEPVADGSGDAQPQPTSPVADEDSVADIPPIPDVADTPAATPHRDEVRAPAAAPADFGDPPASAFDHEPPFRPRRNWLKIWTWAAGIFAIVAAGLIFAVSYWGLPDWVPVERPTFAAGQPGLQLDFPPDQQERRTLPNGTEFFGASGTITNIGTTTRDIPTILIVLRDSRDRIVHSWEVPPPQRTLAPGASVSVSEAVTDIPRSAREVQIGWKPE